MLRSAVGLSGVAALAADRLWSRRTRRTGSAAVSPARPKTFRALAIVSA